MQTRNKLTTTTKTHRFAQKKQKIFFDTKSKLQKLKAPVFFIKKISPKKQLKKYLENIIFGTETAK